MTGLEIRPLAPGEEPLFDSLADPGLVGPAALGGRYIASRNYTDPVIGYVAVLPEHRGHGYAYDLLVEATQLLAAEGADRIIANTDVTNAPMAATFAKAGYPVSDCRIDLVG